LSFDWQGDGCVLGGGKRWTAFFSLVSCSALFHTIGFDTAEFALGYMQRIYKGA